VRWHLFHKWGPWRPYGVTGRMVLGPGTGAPGREVAITETRQFRRCSVCSKVQDEFLSNGPLPDRSGGGA